MEIFIFVWKTSKQAVTDNQNQNLHSNENFFLIKKNNSHSSSVKENWAHLLQVWGVWGLGFYLFFLLSPIRHYSVKFLQLLGRNAALSQEIQQWNPTTAFFFRTFPQNKLNHQGSPSRHSPTIAFQGEYSTRFSAGNRRQLSMEVEDAWGRNEPAFPCVNASLNMFLCFLVALVMAMGSSVCGAGPQHGKPCIAPKYLIL